MNLFFVLGAMGKRTRFQQKELSQLVLQIERLGENNETGVAKTKIPVYVLLYSYTTDSEIRYKVVWFLCAETNRPNEEPSKLPRVVKLDDDTVLEEISFTENKTKQ